MELNARFEGLEMDFSRCDFHILGCGAIGSSAAIQLARMGAEQFTLYDADKVEGVNIGVSQYDNRHIGMPKVEALRDIIQDINSEANTYLANEWFKEYYYNGFTNTIIILGFDSMESRMEAVQLIDESQWPDPAWLIDGRMGAEHYQQYIIKGPQIFEKYLDVWYDDASSDPEPCNLKATSYCSNMAGSFIANAVRKIVTDQPLGGDFSFNFPIMRLSAFTDVNSRIKT